MVCELQGNLSKRFLSFNAGHHPVRAEVAALAFEDKL